MHTVHKIMGISVKYRCNSNIQENVHPIVIAASSIVESERNDFKKLPIVNFHVFCKRVIKWLANEATFSPVLLSFKIILYALRWIFCAIILIGLVGAVSSQKTMNQTVNTENGMKNIGKTEERIVGDDRQKKRLEMLDYSWHRENYGGYTNWRLGGGAVVTGDSVALVGETMNQTGAMWNVVPIKTTSFDMEFVFSVHRAPYARADLTFGSAGFALWYVYENLATILSVEDSFVNGTTLGFRADPIGLGVFFTGTDHSLSRINPSVSASFRLRRYPLRWPQDLPTNKGIYYSFQRSHPFIFKLVVRPSEISGFMRTSMNSQPVPCFHLFNVTVISGGFLGFSAQNWPYDTSQAGIVLIKDIIVWNTDLSLNQGSYQTNQILQNYTDIHIRDVETITLKNLISSTYKVIAETIPYDDFILKSVRNAHSAIVSILQELRFVRKYHLNEESVNDSSVVHDIKSDIDGLKTMFQNHSHHHVSVLHSLTTSLGSSLKPEGRMNDEGKQIKELAKRAKSLEQMINAKNYNVSYMIFGLIFFLFFFCIFVWKRFRDIEKKHLL